MILNLEHQWIGRRSLGAVFSAVAEHEHDAIDLNYAPHAPWMPRTLWVMGPVKVEMVAVGRNIIVDTCEHSCTCKSYTLRQQVCMPNASIQIRLCATTAGRFEGLLLGEAFEDSRKMEAR